MKTLVLISVLSAALFSYPDIANIKTALKSGDVNTLEKHLGAKVELAIGDEEDTYSKEKASELIRGFFSKHQPKSFNEMHQGASKGKATHYCIGILATNSGEYQVTIVLEDAGSGYLIQELRFDEE